VTKIETKNELDGKAEEFETHGGKKKTPKKLSKQ